VRIARGWVAAFVFIATLTSFYWPIIPTPGTVHHWWQIGWLARSGLYYIGFVPLVCAYALGMWGVLETDVEIAVGAWILALGWSSLVYWALGVVDVMLGSRALTSPGKSK
jgi:hypothetical protein